MPQKRLLAALVVLLLPLAVRADPANPLLDPKTHHGGTTILGGTPDPHSCAGLALQSHNPNGAANAENEYYKMKKCPRFAKTFYEEAYCMDAASWTTASPRPKPTAAQLQEHGCIVPTPKPKANAKKAKK